MSSHVSMLVITGSSPVKSLYLFFFLVRRRLTLSATIMSDAMPRAARRSKTNAASGNIAVRRNTSELSAVK